MDVRIISTETIKPSNPTPPQLSSFRLSSLDLLLPQMYVPLIFFYSGDDLYQLKTNEKILRLKNSLSKTLTYFYPLAGRLNKYNLVECNDEGVDFFIARVNDQLTEVLQHPNSDLLSKLLPSDYCSAQSGSDALLAIQVNTFDCGGMAIGVCLCHTMGDGTSLATLVNAWACTARGSSEIISPSFPLTSLFSLKEPKSLIRLKPVRHKVATKSFMFDRSKIEMLRARDPTVASVGFPTRVESISALIWRCAMRARANAGSSKPSVAIHVVNLRGRMVPPLSNYSFGNIFVPSVAESEGSEDTQHCLEVRFREAIGKIDSDYIKKLQGSDEVWDNLNGAFETYYRTGVDIYGFTSWCRIPFYDANFGWGNPAWVSTSGFPKTTFILMGTSSGEGLEVWVNMIEEEMAKFERDEELLAFASAHAI